MELKPKQSDKPGKERGNDFERVHGDLLRSFLEPGESLLGVAAVNWQRSMFKQTVSALGVTGSRLIIQPLDRKGKAATEAPTFIRKEEITKGSYGGGGGMGNSPTSLIMDSASIEVKLKTSGGEKYKLLLMTGEGMFGSMAGGPAQRNGAEALVSFLEGAGRSI
ncbi:MAG: hypothetical protein K1X27_05105 [Solirubrobacterales bacterium]|nr:hypothetical protein [Solirubrobacterales bacterium]HMU26348.1 hypothetical protein [Solirubrobacterales bacterium]HNC92868.1 hypothetical protein [Solirubrobacterales bacterium]HNK66186.1 hypothetical protein [Solirubrobacterales bacterium]